MKFGLSIQQEVAGLDPSWLNKLKNPRWISLLNLKENKIDHCIILSNIHVYAEFDFFSLIHKSHHIEYLHTN